MKIKEINIQIESEEKSDKRILKKLKEFDGGIFPKKDVKTEISFESIKDFKKFLTPKRLQLLHIIKHKKPPSIYKLAEDIGRDRKSVTTDINLLANLGFIELIKENKIRNVVRPLVCYNKIKLGILI